MTEENIITLKEQLQSLGFEKIVTDFDFNKLTDQDSFTLFHYAEIFQDQLMYVLRVNKTQENKPAVEGYVLGIRHIPIPDVTIAGINTRKLETKIIKAEELRNQFSHSQRSQDQGDFISATDDLLMKLFNSGQTGRELAQVMIFKYWPTEEWERFIPDESLLLENYEAKLVVPLDRDVRLTAAEAYEKIKIQFSIQEIEGMNKEHVISNETIQWAQFELSNGRNWIAYNTVPYFLEKSDMQFFKNKDQAMEFSDNNISEFDDYKVIYSQSIRDVLKQIPYGNVIEHQINNLITKNLSIMNEKNLTYLKDNLKYMGFGDKLNEPLEKNIQAEKVEFQLKFETEFNKQKMEAVLHFKKGDQGDMYFFNKYDATLRNENDPTKDIQQTFYVNKTHSITVKEAFNLLNGRAVNTDLTTKEGQKYNAWIQLDFSEKEANGNYKAKQFHENYGFDISTSIGKYPIKELQIPDQKDALLQSLKKGNLQMVTFQVNGSDQRLFIEANPQFKTINAFDAGHHRINLKEVMGKAQEQPTENQNAKQTVKQNPGDEDGPGEMGQKKSRRKRQGQSMG